MQFGAAGLLASSLDHSIWHGNGATLRVGAPVGRATSAQVSGDDAVGRILLIRTDAPIDAQA
jgi:hypothetical protein